MLILATTTDKLQLVTSAGGSINVHASYLDNVAGTVAPGRQNTHITTAATTDIVSPPASGTFRNLKTLHVYNAGTGTVGVIVQHTDGTIVAQLHSVQLAANATLQYVDEVGFLINPPTAPVAAPTTGDLKITHKATADVGWIMWVDGTIGDAVSGASVFADASTAALFTLYYGFTDAQCPLLTSTGAATTRATQGTAAAAYAAHCRMTMPPISGRALAAAGTGVGLTTRANGDAIGLEAITQTIAQLASHQHIPAPGYGYLYNTVGLNNDAAAGPASVAGGGNGPFAGSSSPMPVMQPTAFVNVMVKL